MQIEPGRPEHYSPKVDALYAARRLAFVALRDARRREASPDEIARLREAYRAAADALHDQREVEWRAANGLDA